jgi:hypothetical protein
LKVTKRDYKLIAKTLKALIENNAQSVGNPTFGGFYVAGIISSAECLAIALASDNPRFDRERFLKACGVGL